MNIIKHATPKPVTLNEMLKDFGEEQCSIRRVMEIQKIFILETVSNLKGDRFSVSRRQ